MNQYNKHYKKLLERKKETRLASCGFYDRFDPFVLNKSVFLRRLYGDMFQKFFAGIPCGNLLDIGCGTGIYFDILSGYAEQIHAIDCSEDMIRVASRYCRQTGLNNIFPNVASSGSIPFGNETFDVVIELDTLHHVTDVDKTLREIHRVLKPEGHFFVFEPNIWNPLTFIAHLLPKEERLALIRNRPGKLTALLGQKFQTIRWSGVCELITQTKGLKRLILDAYLKFWESTDIEKLYPRQAWMGVKK